MPVKTNKWDLVIIGAGAAGGAAAIGALDHLEGERILLLEKNLVFGRKLAATGNGKCNFSHQDCEERQYNAASAPLIRNMLKQLSPGMLSVELEKIGILARVDGEGRFYPCTEQAAVVRQAFEGAFSAAGVSCRYEQTVLSIQRQRNVFLLQIADGDSLFAQNVILATGGKAGSVYGCDGSGYKLAKAFGHSIVSPLPALVQVRTPPSEGFSSLKGVRAKGQVTLLCGEKPLASQKGEIQFTETGLSGICIFDLTRFWPAENTGDLFIEIDFFPEKTPEELLRILEKRKTYLAKRITDVFPEGLIHSKLIPLYLKKWGVEGIDNIASLSREKMEEMVLLLKKWRIGVNGTKGWAEAQVTKGGVCDSEVDPLTLESKLVPGLYFAGEILDVDGSCGGRNLQWAFASGFMAGRMAAQNIR